MRSLHTPCRRAIPRPSSGSAHLILFFSLPYVFLMALSSLHAKVTASPFEVLLMGNACNNQPSILKVSPSVCLPVKRNAEG